MGNSPAPQIDLSAGIEQTPAVATAPNHIDLSAGLEPAVTTAGDVVGPPTHILTKDGIQPISSMRAATAADQGADENGLPTSGSPVMDYVHDAENLTQEGRAEHPIKAKLGDVAQKLGEYGDLISDTIKQIGPALGGPIAGETAVADTAEVGSAAKSAAGKVVDKAKSAVPSAQRAGQKMENLREAIGSHPVEMTDGLSKATSRAQELADNGNTMPVSVRKFVNRVTDPDKGHLTYNEARDFLTKFGNLTSEEQTKIAPVMKGQIQKMAGELKDAIGGTAERAGKLEDFQNSMREYASAKKIQNVVDWAKSKGAEYAAKGVLGGGSGYLGYKLLQELKEMID